MMGYCHRLIQTCGEADLEILSPEFYTPEMLKATADVDNYENWSKILINNL